MGGGGGWRLKGRGLGGVAAAPAGGRKAPKAVAAVSTLFCQPHLVGGQRCVSSKARSHSESSAGIEPPPQR